MHIFNYMLLSKYIIFSCKNSEFWELWTTIQIVKFTFYITYYYVNIWLQLHKKIHRQECFTKHLGKRCSYLIYEYQDSVPSRPNKLLLDFLGFSWVHGYSQLSCRFSLTEAAVYEHQWYKVMFVSFVLFPSSAFLKFWYPTS